MEVGNEEGGVEVEKETENEGRGFGFTFRRAFGNILVEVLNYFIDFLDKNVKKDLNIFETLKSFLNQISTYSCPF